MSTDDDDGAGDEPKRGKDGRWLRGKTGNATGRGGKRRGAESPIATALNAKVTLPFGGRNRKYTKEELGANQFANKLAKGDPAALKSYLSWLKFEQARKAADGQATAAVNYVFAEDDLKTIEAMVARIRALPADDAGKR